MGCTHQCAVKGRCVSREGSCRKAAALVLVAAIQDRPPASSPEFLGCCIFLDALDWRLSSAAACLPQLRIACAQGQSGYGYHYSQAIMEPRIPEYTAATAVLPSDAIRLLCSELPFA
jgi:hypothetical protein